jgi:hypothetical protein
MHVYADLELHGGVHIVIIYNMYIQVVYATIHGQLRTCTCNICLQPVTCMSLSYINEFIITS